MNPDNAINIQHKVRQNSDELQNYLLDLKNWEKEMQRKEEALKNTLVQDESNIPPIRNSLSRGKKKNKHKKQKDKAATSPTTDISSFDYKACDKFDDSELNNTDKKQSSASENSENEEDLFITRRKQLAILDKDKGNEYFKKGDYDQAINRYTSGIELDADNPLLPANRAMAFLKKQQFQSAENDCTLCLSIDPTYVKAYLRRGTARSGLKKFDLAKEDFNKALEFEPENKQAKLELKKLKKGSRGADSNKTARQDSKSDDEVMKVQNFWPQFLGHKSDKESSVNSAVTSEEMLTKCSEIRTGCKHDESCVISPIQKSLGERSKKPLMDIKIKDVNPVNDVSEEIPIERHATEEKSIASTSKIEPNKSTTAAEEVEVTLKVVIPKVLELSVPPPVPQTSFQFLADWKKVKKNPAIAYEYLKQFPPERLPSIFKHSMDTELFSGFLQTLSTSFLENGDDVYLYLKNLSEVGRFNTLIMFLSSSEKEALKNVLDSIKSSQGHDSEVMKVMKRYSAV